MLTVAIPSPEVARVAKAIERERKGGKSGGTVVGIRPTDDDLDRLQKWSSTNAIMAERSTIAYLCFRIGLDRLIARTERASKRKGAK